MNSMKLIGVVALSLALLSPGPSQDEAAVKKQKTIRELLAQTGAANLGKEVFAQMGAVLEKSMPGEFKDFWKEFTADVKVEELEDLIVPIYDKHFTQEELEGILEFNKTPLGQKIIRTMPDVMKESMAAGADWGRGLATRAMERFQEKRKEHK
jgi:hypothetical protein